MLFGPLISFSVVIPVYISTYHSEYCFLTTGDNSRVRRFDKVSVPLPLIHFMFTIIKYPIDIDITEMMLWSKVWRYDKLKMFLGAIYF